MNKIGSETSRAPRVLIVPVALAVSAAVVLTAGATIAYADEPANCADAVVALNEANADHKAAVDADKAAADAKAADEALERAQEKKVDADEAAASARADLATKQATLDGLLANDPDASEQATKDAQVAVDVATKKVADADRAVTKAQDELAAAEDKAEATDAGALQVEADKTDVVVTQRALDEARVDFDRECGPGADPTSPPTTVTITPTPAPADDDDDVVVPSGGVDTGGGPA